MHRRLIAALLGLAGVSACSQQSSIPSASGAVGTTPVLEAARQRRQTTASPGPPTYPIGSLIAVGDVLYGVASLGGTSNRGAVFTFDTTTNSETTLHSFAQGKIPQGSLVAIDGSVYGATFSDIYGPNLGTVYGVDQSTGSQTLFHEFAAADGKNPAAGLLALNGEFYGTASAGGGSCGCGSIFEVNPKTGTISSLYEFAGGSDGSDPESRLIEMNGELYGTTRSGGDVDSEQGSGTVFEFDPSTRIEKVLARFSASGADGIEPYGRLLAVDGELYGTTQTDGTASGHQKGTVFKVDPATGTLTTIHDFPAYKGDGAYPDGYLIDVDGFLYGMTDSGGMEGGEGTVFKIDLATNEEHTIHAFQFQGGTDGDFPLGGLVELNGSLYGTTSHGGTNNHGTIFKMNLYGKETVIYNF